MLSHVNESKAFEKSTKQPWIGKSCVAANSRRSESVRTCSAVPRWKTAKVRMEKAQKYDQGVEGDGHHICGVRPPWVWMNQKKSSKSFPKFSKKKILLSLICSIVVLSFKNFPFLHSGSLRGLKPKNFAIVLHQKLLQGRETCG